MAERFTDTNANLTHRKSVEILTEVGFCVPEKFGKKGYEGMRKEDFHLEN